MLELIDAYFYQSKLKFYNWEKIFILLYLKPLILSYFFNIRAMSTGTNDYFLFLIWCKQRSPKFVFFFLFLQPFLMVLIKTYVISILLLFNIHNCSLKSHNQSTSWNLWNCSLFFAIFERCIVIWIGLCIILVYGASIYIHVYYSIKLFVNCLFFSISNTVLKFGNSNWRLHKN